MHCVIFAVTMPKAERLHELEHEEEFFQELETAPKVDVGQQWHGLHYLLTGTASGFPAPRGFLVEGGEEIGTDDGYGSPRWFSPREVDDIHSVLVDISEEELWRHFDAAQMNADQVYPFNWHEEPEQTRRVYQRTFRELKKFVDEASRRGQYLVVTLH
jgi:hypothetical protein